MILISHRGNTKGKSKNENHPDYIIETSKMGFNVEIDVWYNSGNFYLGHDKPQYQVNKKFLINSKFWCHAKNSSAIYELSKTNAHFFWHQNDDYTLTSKGFIWVYPNKKYFKNSIIMVKKKTKVNLKKCKGICSDFIFDFVS
jgi:hypothetical protein